MARATSLLVVALLGLASSATPQEAGPRPNLVLFVADDLGWNGVGYHGGPIETPHIDALAESGVRLERFYALPTCTPARAALLTGRYPIRYGLQSDVIRPWTEAGLDLEERLLSETLHDAGYVTALVGKWHLGHATRAYLPTRRGFDHQYGNYTGWIDSFRHRRLGVDDWNRDDKPIGERGHATDLIASEAERLLRERDPEKPLFLLISFTAPHGPFQPTDEYRERYAALAEEDSTLADYAALITHLDAAVGRTVATLDELGLRDDTLVLFLSDNGGMQEVPQANLPLRAAKLSLYEGGVRVPAVASWPGHLPAGAAIEEVVHITDLLPTLLGVAGVDPDGERQLDGRDVWPVLAEGASSPHTELLLNASDSWAGLLAGRWKLVLRTDDADAKPELYDLETDPNEEHDVAAEHPVVTQRLGAVLEGYRSEAAPEVNQIRGASAPNGFSLPARWGHPRKRRKHR